MERIEHNIATGEVIIIQMTAEEISDAEANAQRVAQEQAKQAPAAPVDPVQKLRSFLAENPDVAQLLNQ